MDYRDAVLYISLFLAAAFIALASAPYPETAPRAEPIIYVEVKRICVTPIDGKLNVTAWLQPVAWKRDVYVEITVGDRRGNTTGGYYPANKTTSISIIVDGDAAVNNTVTIYITYYSHLRSITIEKKAKIGTCM